MILQELEAQLEHFNEDEKGHPFKRPALDLIHAWPHVI